MNRLFFTEEGKESVRKKKMLKKIYIKKKNGRAERERAAGSEREAGLEGWRERKRDQGGVGGESERGDTLRREARPRV